MKRKIKGFRDIVKHSDLSRRRSLLAKSAVISLTLGPHRPISGRREVLHDDWQKTAINHLYQKKSSQNGNGNGTNNLFSLKDKRKIQIFIEYLEAEILELREFEEEGISVATEEIRRREEQLSRFQKYLKLKG